MKPIAIVLISMGMLFVRPLQDGTAQAKSPVRENGETYVFAESRGNKVKVTIKTHEVDIGQPTDEWPEVKRTACTYSRYPCSLVDYIDISVNDKPILVSRSVFCDIADLNSADIMLANNGYALILEGGDASESYIAKIAFNNEMVTRRTIESSMVSNEPTEETNYRKVILKGD